MDYLITTQCGTVKGTAGRIDGIAAYKGIRYATAGRWEYPKQVTHWDGVYDATQYGSCAYQARAFYNEAEVPEKAFYYKEFRENEQYTYSEDCLFLNIWTPADAREGDALPVLIYIHGGSFTGGCGHEKHFDGPVWPAKGVIGVTLNYRLGPLGFLCLPELKEEAGATGNYGLYDQVTAIRWVKDNIAAFGGDPNNITIMGQSAGAISVQQHCLSPMTDGLFQKAVMSSGGGVSKMMQTPLPDKYYDFWHTVMEKTDSSCLDAFRKVSVDKLFSAWETARKENKIGNMAVFPVQDGNLVTGNGKELLKAGKQKQIPYMIGSTSEDIVPPIVHRMAQNWCAAQNVPSYCWFFQRQLPGDDRGAWHSSDLWYWFGTLNNCWRPMVRRDYALAEQMTDYLTNFAKTGNPNSHGLPAWYPAVKHQKQALHFGEGLTQMGNASIRQLWKTMLFRSYAGER